jgi:hypothetical protein
MHSFCQALGPEEGNRQLRRHWRTWLTEADILKLEALGIDTLRVPVGDWMWRPYGPYVGCTDGSLDELRRLLDMAETQGLKVMLDLHAVEGSQNGFDSSGFVNKLRWVGGGGRRQRGSTTDAPDGRGSTPTPTAAENRSLAPRFEHWDHLRASFFGRQNEAGDAYTTLDYGRFDQLLDVLATISEQFAAREGVVGVQLLNEPSWEAPLGPLQRLYWVGRCLAACLCPLPSFGAALRPGPRALRAGAGGVAACLPVCLPESLPAWLPASAHADSASLRALVTAPLVLLVLLLLLLLLLLPLLLLLHPRRRATRWSSAGPPTGSTPSTTPSARPAPGPPSSEAARAW